MASMAGILAQPWNIIDVIVSTSPTHKLSETQTPSNFPPQHTKIPSIAAIDAYTTAAQELVVALSNSKPNTPWEMVGNRQLAALRSLAHIFQYETSKHTAKSRVEASNPRVSNSLPPLRTQTRMPAHQYPTHSTHAANLISVINHKNLQEVVPAQPTGTNIQYANAIIDKDTGGALEYRHLINR